MSIKFEVEKGGVERHTYSANGDFVFVYIPYEVLDGLANV